ncbi:hypothetical protein MTR67_025936 [Solanum verrucosum]|uniref:Uncharacterized protein n=1 Tax=Solanum verrucosum TaxID=315347 RepID=A0AAF0QZL4_SOLVR|nr:hypothetical protein MTR67_025936 [Solanum verrucosum]
MQKVFFNSSPEIKGFLRGIHHQGWLGITCGPRSRVRVSGIVSGRDTYGWHLRPVGRPTPLGRGRGPGPQKRSCSAPIHGPSGWGVDIPTVHGSWGVSHA